MMKSMKKKRTDQRLEMGSWVKASGYAMNARPNPEKRSGENINRWVLLVCVDLAKGDVVASDLP